MQFTLKIRRRLADGYLEEAEFMLTQPISNCNAGELALLLFDMEGQVNSANALVYGRMESNRPTVRVWIEEKP